MKLINTKVTAMAAAMSLAVTASVSMAAGPGKGSTPYEVWAADQSNSVAGEPSRGIDGSYLWIWQGEDVGKQIKNGTPAVPQQIDLHSLFPGSLEESDKNGPTTNTLGSLHAAGENFGRLHGMIADPQNMYMNINSFVTGDFAGGYVGIVDGVTKEPVALFQVTKTSAGRSLHMSFWNSDGSALLLANLHGRILERINIDRDPDGTITGAHYDLDASLNVGAAPTIINGASAFNGNGMVPSDVVGDYTDADGDGINADLGDTTPEGHKRQDDSSTMGTIRPTNVIVCPIVSSSDKVYITFGGGGLLVADGNATPMNIIAEYDQATVNGAGCGGVQDPDGVVWLNAGASAGGAGATQSTHTMYGIDDNAPMNGMQGENMPAPMLVYRDAGNTKTLGNPLGDASNGSGQLPGVSTRRDAHGMARTLDGAYIHQGDRIQNNIEVFRTSDMSHVGSYDLTSANGQGAGMGPCAAASVFDDAGLPGNDPAPDLMGTTPDGKYLVVATRGPVPVSVGHNAQGSCPGVGIIKLSNKGDSGKLVTVLRTTNTVDTAPNGSPTGGYAYRGVEHSDPHGASVRVRVEDMK